METPDDVKRDCISRLQNTSISNTQRWILEALLILARSVAQMSVEMRKERNQREGGM